MIIETEAPVVLEYKQGYYTEATQEQDPNLTLVYPFENAYKALFPACRCKDFFNELFKKIHCGGDYYTYGFNTKTFDTEHIKHSEYFYLLLVGRAQPLPINNIRRFLSLFNPKSFVTEAVEPVGGVIVKFHRNWTDRPYLLSMFINLCRVGTLYTQDSWEEFKEYLGKSGIIKSPHCSANTCSQVIKSMEVIEDYMDGIIHPQSYDQYKTVSSLHNESGSVSFTIKLKETINA